MTMTMIMTINMLMIRTMTVIMTTAVMPWDLMGFCGDLLATVGVYTLFLVPLGAFLCFQMCS